MAQSGHLRQRPVSSGFGLDLQAVQALYHSALPAARAGPLFNAFSYPTKISPEAIALFIATHTQPGAVVVDVFAGSGTTGLATRLCEYPTPRMIAMSQDLGVSPSWGARDAHLFDVSTIGCFVASVMTSPPDPARFEAAAADFIAELGERLSGLYDTKDPAGVDSHIRHTIHSEVLICPACAATHRLWDVAVTKDPAAFSKTFNCDACNERLSTDQCERVMDESPDVFGHVTRRRRHVPVEVHGVTGKWKWSRPATASDDAGLDRWSTIGVPDGAPDQLIEWGELRRSGYHAGLERLHHFYTPRNFVAMATALKLAGEAPEDLAPALKLLALSYNASHSTLMTRVVAKTNQKDFILTGAQSGVLYVSGLPVEKNIILGLARKAGVLRDAFALVHGGTGKVVVHNATSEQLPLADASVDYIFTDPPFGDYIPYAELNQINELWLGSATDRTAETVVSRSGGKDVDHYQASMTTIFTEINRVLKPAGLVTVVFHSAHARIWRALTEALSGARLHVHATSVLDKLQASFKQVVSTISVKGDPLILLGKTAVQNEGHCHVRILETRLVEARRAGSRDVRPHYSQYAADCIAHGVPIELDAVAFAARVAAPHRDAA